MTVVSVEDAIVFYGKEAEDIIASFSTQHFLFASEIIQ